MSHEPTSIVVFSTFVTVLCVTTSCAGQNTLIADSDSEESEPTLDHEESEPTLDHVDEDEGVCADNDSDGFLDAACGGDDCDDGDDSIHPGAEEVCSDGVDQDCDGYVDGARILIDPVAVNDPITNTVSPDIFWSGSDFILAWVDLSGGSEQIYFKRINPGGDEAWPVRILSTSFNAYNPSISVVADTIYISWDAITSGGDIGRIARIDAISNDVLSEVSVSDSVTSTYVEQVSNEEGVISLWLDYGPSFYLDLMFAKHTLALEPAVAARRLVYGGELAEPPSIEQGASNLAVAWSSETTIANYDISYMLVDYTGEGVAEATLLASSSVDNTNVEIAGNEYGYDILWNALDDTSSSRVVSHARISRDGEITLPAEVLTELGENSYDADIVWDEYSMNVIVQEAIGDASSIVFYRLSDDRLEAESRVEVGSAVDGYGANELIWTGSDYAIFWLDSFEGKARLMYSRLSLCD